MVVECRSDFAVIATPRFKAYYGGDYTDPATNDWCFVVIKNDKEVFRKTNSELLAYYEGGGPAEMLLVGLGLYLSK